jgi:phage N-6-adenine-methyltransferase
MANDLWRTPVGVINYIEKRYGKIVVDLCASSENKVTDNYFSAENSFLDSDLRRYGGLCFCNPPYSDPLPFVNKCIELADFGNNVLMLLNMDVSTKWFARIHESATMIIPVIGGRISFCDEDGTQIKGNSKPQIMCLFTNIHHKDVAWSSVNIRELK